MKFRWVCPKCQNKVDTNMNMSKYPPECVRHKGGNVRMVLVESGNSSDDRPA